MSKAKKSLTTSDIQTLVKLNTAYKKAKKAFDEAKANLVPDSVAAGKYVLADVGSVSKLDVIQTVVDYKQLIADHPEIDLEIYTNHKEAPRIVIVDFSDGIQVEDDESFMKKLLRR